MSDRREPEEYNVPRDAPNPNQHRPLGYDAAFLDVLHRTPVERAYLLDATVFTVFPEARVYHRPCLAGEEGPDLAPNVPPSAERQMRVRVTNDPDALGVQRHFLWCLPDAVPPVPSADLENTKRRQFAR